jgi:hypothetical protein
MFKNVIIIVIVMLLIIGTYFISFNFGKKEGILACKKILYDSYMWQKDHRLHDNNGADISKKYSIDIPNAEKIGFTAHVDDEDYFHLLIGDLQIFFEKQRCKLPPK